LLRDEAIEALKKSDRILHAGDIGSREILERLQEIAPVAAVRGNVDTAPWALALPVTRSVDIAGAVIYMIHDRSQLAIDPVRKGISAVVFGHTHKALIETHHSVLYLNPGSAGPRRFNLPVTLARLKIKAGRMEPEIIHLKS
jgi:putative phosphoesterase